MPVLCSENSHGLRGGKGGTGVYQQGWCNGIRKTGGKSEESGHDRQEEEQLWWKCGRMEVTGCGEREKTHQARCPNNGRGWLDTSNKDGRRLRGCRRGRRLGHPTAQGKDKPAGCNRSPCHTTFRPPLLIRFLPKIFFYFRLQNAYRTSCQRIPKFAEKPKQKEDGARRGLPASKHRTASVTATSGMPRHPLPNLRFQAQTRPTPILASRTPTSSAAHQRTYHPKRKAFRSCESFELDLSSALVTP